MKFRVIVIFDVYLVYLRNEFKYILVNLDNNFLGYLDVKDFDIIFIVGDLFDRLFEFINLDKFMIYMWFIRLCLFCSRNNIILCILEGILFYDWK